MAKIKEVGADIVAMSSLMSTTAPRMKDVVVALKEEGIRDGVKILVGVPPQTKHLRSR